MRRLILLAIAMMTFSATKTSAGTLPGRKMLVVYYSHTGNTRAVAQQIAEATGADIFEIVPATAYPTKHDVLVAQAKREIADGYRPALKGTLPDLGAYDVVFVGSPSWWATVAPPVATFLAAGEWAGKTVVPFMTHEGSRMGRSEDDIRKLCVGATLLPGLPVRGGAANDSQEAVTKWLRTIKLIN